LPFLHTLSGKRQFDFFIWNSLRNMAKAIPSEAIMECNLFL
jgi:hypothetical protein